MPPKRAAAIDCDYADPAAVLRAFMAAMNVWEADAYRTFQTPLSAAQHRSALARVRRQLDHIFAAFCTPKERPHGRQACCAASAAPTYDLERETVLQIDPEKPGRVSIHTERAEVGPTPRTTRHVYILLKQAGRWLLDSKTMLDHRGRPMRDYL